MKPRGTHKCENEVCCKTNIPGDRKSWDEAIYQPKQKIDYVPN